MHCFKMLEMDSRLLGFVLWFGLIYLMYRSRQGTSFGGDFQEATDVFLHLYSCVGPFFIIYQLSNTCPEFICPLECSGRMTSSEVYEE
jgi:hypothetical protein